MEMPEGLTVCRASLEDAPVIVGHRRSMFRDMGYQDEAALDSMSVKFLPWLVGKMKAGEYLAWLGTAGDHSIVAGAGLWLMDWPPHMIGAAARRGNIVNVYTERSYRRRGLARVLMECALTWCREHRVDTVILHASLEGRPLYESMGFEASNEMRIKL